LNIKDGLDISSCIVPLINKKAVGKVSTLIGNTKIKIWKVLCVFNAHGNFMKPSIIGYCKD
jgi:hypothetical protein